MVAIALIVYKENIPELRLSVVNNYMSNSKASRFFGKAIDVFVMVAILCGISTSLGLAVPIMSNLISTMFSIPNSLGLKIFIVAIWIIIFTTSVFRGLDKGIKILSDINIIILIVFASIIFIAGPSIDILKMEVNSIGLFAENFIRINTWTDPFGSGDFQKMWTYFYWGWWLTFMPLMALFIVRVSRGRTIRNVVVQQLVWGSLGCWFCFAIFGGYSLYIQKSGAIDIVYLLENYGQEEAMAQILNTIPFTKILVVVFCVLLFVFLATTIDSAAYILATNCSRNLSINSQPSRIVRIFWALVLAVLSIGLLVVDELTAVQTIALIASLPLIPIQFYMCRSGV
ncbi:MAG: hypothetical protein GX269_04370 [Clostridiales bacterium]|nr:hypothetical protein [Clostridiales bacterium]